MVMARDEPYRVVRSAHDYPGVDGVERVHARYDGVASITASTSGGYADTLGPVRPEVGPFAAVDGLAETYWQSSPLTDPVGQWVEVRFAQPASLDRLSVQVGVDGFSGLPIRRVRVDVGDQSRAATVDPATGLVEIGLDGRPVDRVRLTVTGVAGTEGVVAVREISIPGGGDRPAAGRSRAGDGRHHLRPPRASTAARVHRRGPGCELRLRHRRAGR